MVLQVSKQVFTKGAGVSNEWFESYIYLAMCFNHSIIYTYFLYHCLPRKLVRS